MWPRRGVVDPLGLATDLQTPHPAPHSSSEGGIIPAADLKLNHLNRIGLRTIGGHGGALYRLPPNRISLFSGHYTFVWHSGGWRYVTSMHRWTPYSSALAVLSAIVAHLEPLAR